MFELFSIGVPPCEMCKWRIQPEQVETKYTQAKKPNMHTWRSQRTYLKSSTSPISPILPFLPFSNSSSLSCAHNCDNLYFLNSQLKFITYFVTYFKTAARFSTKITRTFLKRKRRKRITYSYQRSDQTLLSMGGFVNIIAARNIKSFLVFFPFLR